MVRALRGKPTTALKKPKLVLSISKNETNCRFFARSTKSADISNKALESGRKVFSNDLGGLREVQADIMFATIFTTRCKAATVVRCTYSTVSGDKLFKARETMVADP